jgi:hypothetical protein
MTNDLVKEMDLCGIKLPRKDVDKLAGQDCQLGRALLFVAQRGTADEKLNPVLRCLLRRNTVEYLGVSKHRSSITSNIAIRCRSVDDLDAIAREFLELKGGE